MNQNFENKAGGNRKDKAGHDEPFDTSGPITVGTAHRKGNSANGQSVRPPISAWGAIDMLVRRFGWLLLGGMVSAGLFLFLGWNVVKPKFTADAQLERYETPAAGDFFKSAPLSSETFAALLRSPELLRRVGETVQPPVAPEAMAKCIKIDPQPDSDIVKVLIAARTPEYAVKLLNNFNEEAIKFTKEWQQERARTVSQDYLLKLLGQMNQDINSLSNQFRGMPISSQVSDKIGQLGSNVMSLSNNLAASPRPTMLINMQRERLAKETEDLKTLLMTYTEQHPLVKAAQSRVDELSSQIERALTSTNSGNAGAMATLLASRPPETSTTEQDIIRTKLRSLEDARIQMLNRQREAELFAANPPGMIRVLAPANLKTVHRNMREAKIGIVTVFGFLVGVGGMLLLVTLVELTDRRLHTVDDVQRVTKLPVLTTLGNLQRMEESERTRWAFRTWTMLQGRLSRSSNHGLVCGITSSAAGEGRSTWIQLLAEAASHTGFRVLTIATRPSTHVERVPEEEPSQSPEDRAASFFQETQKQDQTQADGQAEPVYAAAQANPEPVNGAVPQAMQQAPATTANVLSRPNTVTEALTGPNSQPMVHIPLPGWVWNLERRKQWREALVHWRQIENLVIFVELPPASVAEAVLLGSNLPNLVWLTESGVADATETREQLETLRHARCNLVGAVLNRESSVSVRRRFPRWVDSFATMFMLLACGLTFSTSFTSNVSAAAPSYSELPPASPGLAPRPIYPDIPRVAPQPAPIAPQPAPVIPQQPTAKPEPVPDNTEPALAAQPTPQNTNASFSIVNPAQRAEWQRHLTLGPGDVLNFGLFDHPEMARTEVPIRPDGYVGYLEADNVLASGLTIDELREKMDQALSQFRRAPRTLITPVAFRSKKYYMLGKVMTKGVYILDRPITVLEAVARAHGLENGLVDRNIIDIADFQHSFLARGGKRINLNFEKLFQDGDLSQNIAIEPDDYLYFPSAAAQEVYVVGEVRLPGPVTFTPDTTIMAAITSRGGYTDRAYKARVVVVRGSINSPQAIAVDTHAILNARAPDFQLRPRDIIYVNSRPFIKVEELADLAATAFIQSLITSWVGVDVVKPIQ